MKIKLIALVIVCIGACGCSHTQSKTGAASHGGEQTASKDRPAADGAECDDYIRLVSRCIETPAASARIRRWTLAGLSSFRLSRNECVSRSRSPN
jgi:hypothetical protein